MMTELRLFGELAQRVGGAVWHFEVACPSELFQALNIATRGKFTEYMLEHSTTAYHFLINDQPVMTFEELAFMRYAAGALRKVEVVPALVGSGGDWWMTIVGFALVLLALFVPVLSPVVGGVMATGLGGGMTVGMLTFAVGSTLLLSGLAAALAPATQATEAVERKRSYFFSGASNYYEAGGPVPIGFGLLEVGSQVITAGVRAVDEL